MAKRHLYPAHSFSVHRPFSLFYFESPKQNKDQVEHKTVTLLKAGMIAEAAKPVICLGGYLNAAASLVPCKGCFGLLAHLEKILLIVLSHLWNRALWWQHCCKIEGNLCFTIRQRGKCSHISGLRVMSLKDEVVKRETKHKTVDSHCMLANRKTFHPGTNVLARLDYAC